MLEKHLNLLVNKLHKVVDKAKEELPHLINKGKKFAEDKFHEYLPKATEYLKDTGMNYLHSLAPVAETVAENPELLAGGRLRMKHHKHHEHHEHGGALLPAGYGLHSVHHKKSLKKQLKNQLKNIIKENKLYKCII